MFCSGTVEKPSSYDESKIYFKWQHAKRKFDFSRAGPFISYCIEAN